MPSLLKYIRSESYNTWHASKSSYDYLPKVDEKFNINFQGHMIWNFIDGDLKCSSFIPVFYLFDANIPSFSQLYLTFLCVSTLLLLSYRLQINCNLYVTNWQPGILNYFQVMPGPHLPLF